MPARPLAPDHLRLGNAGEDAAWEHLKSRGYTLLARNWTKRRYELDLVCEDGDTLVFVEVKTRAPGMRGSPADALTRDKMLRLVKAAAYYLTQQHYWDRPCRFDLVSVSGLAGAFEVEHVEDAFHLSDVPGAGRFWQC